MFAEWTFETCAQMVIIFQGKIRSRGALGTQSGENLIERLGWTLRRRSHLARDGEEGIPNRDKIMSRRAKVRKNRRG